MMNDIPTPESSGDRPRILRIAEVNTLVRTILEEEIGRVWVEGEISNLSRPRSGHLYFTLKDDNAQIRAVCFRGDQRRISIAPADGMKVRVYGEVTMYERGGTVQILCRRMEEAGLGALYEAFEKLKAKLSEEGLFADERKRPLPALPQRIGVITSATGAAIRDILNVVRRRFPNLYIAVFPVSVQGDRAPPEIVEALEFAQTLDPPLDALILGRGGGSLEDLWAFNEERVARAVAACRLPIISAVGHETDVTICDLAADIRAPTPSAAAELVIGPKEQYLRQLDQARRRLIREARTAHRHARRHLVQQTMTLTHRADVSQHRTQQHLDDLTARLTDSTWRGLRARRTRLRYARDRLAAQSPAARLTRDSRRLQQLVARLQQGARAASAEARLSLRHRAMRLSPAARRNRDRLESRVRRAEAQLRALSPQSVLDRGFSVTRTEDGRVLRSASETEPGRHVETILARGRIRSRVSQTEEGDARDGQTE